MNENAKQKISLGYSILLILLAAVFTVFSVLPIITLDAGSYTYPELYETGRFTAGAKKPKEVGIGLSTAIPVVANFGDIVTVIGIQALDGNIKTQREYISELTNENASDDRIDREREELSDLIEKRDAKVAEVTEEDIARIKDKLQNDQGFIDVIGTIYGMAGNATSNTETVFDNASDLGISTLDITITILSVIFLVLLLGVGIVFSIIIIIKFIILLVQALKHIKDGDMDATDNRMDKFPFTTYSAMMLMFFMLYSLVSSGIGMGIAVKGAVVVFIITCLLRAVKSIVFAEENRVLAITKQAITALSLVAAILLLVNFIGIDPINEYDNVIIDMSKEQYQSEIDKLEDSDLEGYEITDKAEKAVAAANGRNTAIVVVLGLVGAMLIVTAVINAIERFGNKKMKLKTGEFVPYKAMVVLSVFLLILAILPSLLTVKSKEEREDAFKEGQFKIWYSEYKEEGTKANLEYEFLTELYEEGKEELAELREDLKAAEGEKAETLAEQVEEAEYTLNTAKEKIDGIEARAQRPVLCIVFAAIFLVSEYAYMIVPKILMKKEDEAAPAPVEE